MSDAAFDRSRVLPEPPGLGPWSFAVDALIGRLTPSGAPRFLVAGGLASFINWTVRFPLSIVLPFEVAVGLAYGLGMVVGFELYRSWVFPGSTLPLRSQIARFILVNAGGLAMVIFGSNILVAAIGWMGLLPAPATEGLAHGLAILCGAVVNFVGHRAVTFARRAAGLR